MQRYYIFISIYTILGVLVLISWITTDLNVRPQREKSHSIYSTGIKTTTENQFLHFEREIERKKRTHTYTAILNFVCVISCAILNKYIQKERIYSKPMTSNYKIWHVREKKRKRIWSQSSTSRIPYRKLFGNKWNISKLESKMNFFYYRTSIYNMQWLLL